MVPDGGGLGSGPVAVGAALVDVDRHGRKRGRIAPILQTLVIAYVGIVLWLTLGPAPWAATRVAEIPFGVLTPVAWLSPTTWSTGSPREFLLNVAMFIPIGVIAARLPGTWTRFLAPIVLTVFIEIVQIPLIDRVSDPRDLVANILGGLLGLLAGRWLASRERRR